MHDIDALKAVKPGDKVIVITGRANDQFTVARIEKARAEGRAAKIIPSGEGEHRRRQ